MSTRYSIRLYFPTEKIEQALLATTEIADQPESWQNIKLPDNRKVLVPFHSSDQKRPHLQIGKSIALDTTLLFPVDEIVQEYITMRQTADTELKLVHGDGEDYCPIGIIWLIISSGSRYTEFDFAAVTSLFNDILLKSNAAHQQFLKVLNSADGVAGLIDVETRRFHLLHDPTLTIYLNENRYYLDVEYGDGVDRDIDRLAEAIRSKISNL